MDQLINALEARHRCPPRQEICSLKPKSIQKSKNRKQIKEETEFEGVFKNLITVLKRMESSSSDAGLKQQLEELQKQLGKKQRFEEAVSSINSLLKLHYLSASPSLRKLVISLFVFLFQLNQAKRKLNFNMLSLSLSVFFCCLPGCNHFENKIHSPWILVWRFTSFRALRIPCL